jgi:1-deoxy-D-xylulose-5-phosphate synthase
MPAAFDVAYLASLPTFRGDGGGGRGGAGAIWSDRGGAYDDGPIAVRYPRGNGVGVELPARPQPLAKSARAASCARARRVAILSLGTRLAECLKAAEHARPGRVCRPLSPTPLRQAARRRADPAACSRARGARSRSRNAVGGFGSHVLTMASDEGLIDAGLKLRTMRLPDRFQDQDKPELQYDEAGLNAPHIVETVLKALRWNEAEVGAIA